MTPTKNVHAAMITTVDMTISVGILSTWPVLKTLKRIGKKYIAAMIRRISEATEKYINGRLSRISAKIILMTFIPSL
jgi:hypothetical protein